MKVGRDTPLLVVDELVGGSAVRSHLRQLGFLTIDVAVTGREALDRVGATKYGAVLCEWALFDTDALLLLRAIRTMPRHRALPFLVVTANRDPAAVTAAKHGGVSRYVLKPYSLATLRKQLEHALGAMTWTPTWSPAL